MLEEKNKETQGRYCKDPPWWKTFRNSFTSDADVKEPFH